MDEKTSKKCFVFFKFNHLFEKSFLDSRLVEITMIFHILKDRESCRQEFLNSTGGAAANWATAAKKMRDNIVICNYKFLRDMSKNSTDDSWIISGLNHWLPSEYEYEQQQKQ